MTEKPPELPSTPLGSEPAVGSSTSLYDGLFLALALQLGGQLVTADHKLFKKIEASRHAEQVRWVVRDSVTYDARDWGPFPPHITALSDASITAT